MDVRSVEMFSRAELLASLRRVRLRGFDGALVYRDASLEVVEGLDPASVVPAQNYVLRGGVERVGALRTALRPWGVDPLAMDGGATIALGRPVAEGTPAAPTAPEDGDATVRPDRPAEGTPAAPTAPEDGDATVGPGRPAAEGTPAVPTAPEDDGATATTDEDGTTVTLLPPIVEESREPDGSTVLLVCDGLHRTYHALSHGLTLTAVVVRGASHPYYAFPLPGGWDDVTVLDELPETHQKKVYRHPDNYKALFRDLGGVFPGVQTQRRRSNPTTLTPGTP
ncbi:hypothetical protein [Phycicoccus flavus]|uniref:ParB-like catalytic effector domain-containing protein n=1 Tax=Phycicoccus flavus TaxID=2502783 RepID=A0A8T6R7B7_9MICO|nr:hypothetical protein [Phycicoccus flavus]NHA69340.1 hypothetical protein [Phycicoccus flavus]